MTIEQIRDGVSRLLTRLAQLKPKAGGSLSALNDAADIREARGIVDEAGDLDARERRCSSARRHQTAGLRTASRQQQPGGISHRPLDGVALKQDASFVTWAKAAARWSDDDEKLSLGR